VPVRRGLISRSNFSFQPFFGLFFCISLSAQVRRAFVALFPEIEREPRTHDSFLSIFAHIDVTLGALATRLINRSPCISSFVHSNAEFAPNFSSSGIDATHLSQLLADVFVNNGRVSRLDVLLSCFPAVLESFVRHMNERCRLVG
jgi:hypothetical protein